MITKDQKATLTMQVRISMKDKNHMLIQRIDQLEAEKATLSDLLAKEIANNQLKGTFLAKAAHELRSPLTNIQLSASLIEHYYQRLDEEKVFRHLAKIKDGVSEFVVVLNQYLLSEEVEKADEHQLNG